MKNMEQLLTVVFGCLAFVSFSASSATISFDDGADPQNGTLSYDGTGGALIGSGIDFYTILGEDTPSNPGIALDCVDCVLDFTTGTNISEGPVVWEFNGGGSLTITGTVKDGVTQIASGTLVSGSFSDAVVTGDGNDASVLILSGFGTDSKNADLLNFFGLSEQGFTFASTNISIGNVNYLGNGGFNGTLTNADFDNITTVVPVPAAVWLFGSGLLGLVGVARRKAA
ncbi:MAG: VPLPA-CTERM sorting domain-containing protein [Pseudomonadota bacterium]